MSTMAEVKVMPYSEKYARVLEQHESGYRAVSPFVRERLGDGAVAELQEIMSEGVEPIPEDASDEEKYEIAYGNWILAAKRAYSFIRERLGEDGIEQFVRAEVEALKRKTSGPALLLLRLVRAVSPGYAFKMIAKRSLYETQWLVPYSDAEIAERKVEIYAPRCKILDFPGVDDICLVGCQRAYPAWMAEQLNVRMSFERRGNSCTITITPLG